MLFEDSTTITESISSNEIPDKTREDFPLTSEQTLKLNISTEKDTYVRNEDPHTEASMSCTDLLRNQSTTPYRQKLFGAEIDRNGDYLFPWAHAQISDNEVARLGGSQSRLPCDQSYHLYYVSSIEV